MICVLKSVMGSAYDRLRPPGRCETGIVIASDLGTLGLWIGRAVLREEVVMEAERLGYGTVWVGGSPGADLVDAERVLAATDRVVVATGIVNIWRADPVETARSFHRLEERFPGRFLLGIGTGTVRRTLRDTARSRLCLTISMRSTRRVSPPIGGSLPLSVRRRRSSRPGARSASIRI